ncbi:trypsin-like serine protease [Streptomyces boncukensis]|uniref:Trypsin-like serine protease n=1 Tax=Streptomyces boncukensis TaxID=2711219 RepID=A0A6G4WWC3_9ACTN|nr:trypsin-like serine protease [Streptomyces boncukensis]NGO68771.1 trypsin-like serine protease [Streptomyces boncukensis]
MHAHTKGRLRALVTLAACALTVPALTPLTSAQALTGPVDKNEAHGFTARLDIGDGKRACSAALVDEQWLLTAASCFADDPAQSLDVPAGAPAWKTTATVGRIDLTSTAGQVRQVVELVPRDDRDLVLARLDTPVTRAAPIPLETGAPSAEEELTATGYGRTKEDWSPLSLHSGTFTTGTPEANDLPVSGKDGVALCKGDTGGPLFRETSGGAKLAGISSRSYQGGCFGSDPEQTSTDAVSVRVDDLKPWVDAATERAPFTDFNGDGVRDIAVADPRATVGTEARAGLVRIAYGGGKGTAEISQDYPGVSGIPETGDQFGDALATVDYNLDGYTDLVVGTPREDIGKEADAGLAQIVYGSASGLGKETPTQALEQGKGKGAIGAALSEAGDRMGGALAAGTTTQGEPYLLIGVPGEDISGVVDCGNAYYLRGKTNVSVHQASPGVPGASEKGDRWGASAAGSPEHLAIGAPNEAIGSRADSGAVTVFRHTLNSDGRPTPLAGIDQNSTAPEINGGAETGDLFASSISMTPYRPTAGSSALPTDTILAIGSPGEGLSDADDAGRVVTVHIPADGAMTQLSDIHQGKPGVTGVVEAGDRFGAQVSAVSTAPGAVATGKNMLMAVGIPGEDIGTTADAGSIEVFSLLGAPGDSDVVVEPGTVGMPGTSGAGQKLGSSIHAAGTHLYAGLPSGPAPYGSAHTVPWRNITDAADDTVTTYEPGRNGLPAAGAAFGTVIR